MNLVEVKNNQVITTSRKVAESFGKEHKVVLHLTFAYHKYILLISKSEVIF